MHVSFGYELVYRCSQATPMLLMLHTHSSRAGDLILPDRMTTDPVVPLRSYRDGAGNMCTRIVAPVERIQITADGIMYDSGVPEPVAPNAVEHPVASLPDETLVYLLGSR